MSGGFGQEGKKPSSLPHVLLGKGPAPRRSRGLLVLGARVVRHRPVLVTEVLRLLVTDPRGCYVDATAGDGGHTAALLDTLDPAATLLAVDRDPEVVADLKARLSGKRPRVVVEQANFRDLPVLMRELGFGRAHGLLLDFGLRSSALDDPGRGFAYGSDGPLDMRFDRTVGRTAADLLRTASRDELIEIFAAGTTRANPARLADAILDWRSRERLERTSDLVAALKSSRGLRVDHKLLSSVFSAIRMAVNAEIEDIEELIRRLDQVLRPGGVLCAISYQSQEDSRIKRLAGRQYRAPQGDYAFVLQPLTRKPIRPGQAELRSNPRSRSARLRAFQLVRGS